MYVDKELEFSLDQVVTVSAASTNIVDRGAAGEIMGAGAAKFIAVTFSEGATASGAATVSIDMQTDDNEAFASPTTVSTSGAIGKAVLVAGKQYFIPFPLGATERYLRLYYTVATGPLTAGKITAQVVDQPQLYKSYPDAL